MTQTDPSQHQPSFLLSYSRTPIRWKFLHLFRISSLKTPFLLSILDSPSTEMSPLQDFNQSPEPCTPPQPTLDQLTFELTQSMKQNEAHVNLISELREENRELRLQIKNMEELHKTVSVSQRYQQVMHALLKAQAKKLKFKQSVSSKSKAVTDAALPPSS